MLERFWVTSPVTGLAYQWNGGLTINITTADQVNDPDPRHVDVFTLNGESTPDVPSVLEAIWVHDVRAEFTGSLGQLQPGDIVYADPGTPGLTVRRDGDDQLFGREFLGQDEAVKALGILADLIGCEHRELLPDRAFRVLDL